MPITQIDCEEAKRIMDEDPEAIYVDVRSIPEFTAGHPAGARNVPIMHKGPGGMSPNADFERVAVKVLPQDKTLLIGCLSGGRSQRACDVLAARGFTKLYNIFGGWGGGRNPETGEPAPGWSDLGFPVGTDNGEGVSYESLAKKANA